MHLNLIDFEISEELKSVVSKFGIDHNIIINIQFTEVCDKKAFNFVFNIKNLEKSLRDFQSRLKKVVPNVTDHHFNLLENTIYENLDKFEPTYNNDKSSPTQQSNSIKYLRKYELDSILYEAIIVDKVPQFVIYNNNDGTFRLLDRIEVANYIIYPVDTITTHNPIPYSFESEQELKKYLTLARLESFNSLFEKVLLESRKYINNEEHTLVIISADTVYSYFQDRFGTTHYNIFVGDNNSGKNSALIFISILGYRPFHVTAASAANYYTFLGELQEGQGIILEDEADNIGDSIDKKNILKTGYASGESVPKIGFTKNGTRFQESYNTFCFKCFAMEELPDDKKNRGLFDRSFIHNFFKGDVSYNIKEIFKDKESDLYKNLMHLRKLLLAFKLVNYDVRFPEIKTNLTARDAELTYPLLRMFYGSENFEKIRMALSQIIYEKTSNKNNSIESKITETLQTLSNNDINRNKEIIYFTNEEIDKEFKAISDSKDNPLDALGSTLYLPDGTKISKYRISKLLKSKFNAKPIRTNQYRGYGVNRKNLEKISRHYKVIKEIVILEEEEENDLDNDKKVTQVTQVTDFKEATPSSNTNSSSASKIIEDNNIETDIDKHDTISDEDSKKLSNNTHSDESNLYNNEKSHESDTVSHQKLELTPPTTPLNCVTSVTCVTAPLPQYPCYFCGTNYKTHIDFDMELHLIEFHKEKLIRLPFRGNMDRRLEYVIAKTKQRVLENSVEPSDDDEEIENEDRGY